ncbi:hypothetical protein BGZ54_001690 [Gamsiella multidivaricata]|nr:hypothetical protein BGZ54_001690 [Gamsiella multidivaricata]
MQTRRRKERENAKAQAGPRTETLECVKLSEADSSTIQDLSVSAPASELQQTQDISPNTMFPGKRKKRPMEPSTPKKIEIPRAATLPPIVWVHDDQYQWWPGKITHYPPQGNRATVARFGNITPKSITVECSTSNILPFRRRSKEPRELEGRNVSLAAAFEAAIKEASQAQLKDDDGLPSLDDIIDQLPTTHASSATHLNASRKKTTDAQRKLIKTDATYLPDSSLTIPGELVLAQSDRFYYPGRIVDYASGHSLSIERKKFYTTYEKGFTTCPLGELARPAIMDNYEDKELELRVRGIYPALYAIISGTHDEAGRLEAFVKGGKARRSLAQRVGPGSFSREKYQLINNLLHSEFLADLATTKRTQPGGQNWPVLEGYGPPMKRSGDVSKGFSDQMRLHFVSDVLLPETITRLTMQQENINYKEADQRVIDCKRDESTDTWWVDDVLAARESFLDGHAQ